MVCRELGFHRGRAVVEAEFGAGVRRWLDQVQCTGAERFLSDCYFNGLANHVCEHSEYAGVVCSGKDYCIPVLHIVQVIISVQNIKNVEKF